MSTSFMLAVLHVDTSHARAKSPRQSRMATHGPSAEASEAGSGTDLNCELRSHTRAASRRQFSRSGRGRSATSLREELERWARASAVTSSSAKRARIVLLAADGHCFIKGRPRRVAGDLPVDYRTKQ
jgi:hypothetical protein